MSCFHIRCTRLILFFLLAALVTSSAGQRASLRSKAEKSAAVQPAAEGKGAETSGEFAVESFLTRGTVQPDSPITVIFTRDVVSVSDIDEGKAPESVFNFEPSIEGTVQWDSPREVRFIPRRSLKQATEYAAWINPMLKSLDGAALSKTPRFRFSTPALTLRSVAQNQFMEDRRVILSLSFSDKVNPKDLRKYVRLRAGDRDVRWTVQSEVATQDLNIITDPLSTETLSVIVEPGLKGASGPLALRNRVEKKVELNFSLVPVSVSGVWVRSDPRLLIEFSDYVNTHRAGNFIQITPHVDVTYSSSGNTLYLRGAFEPEKRYTVLIREGFQNDGKAVIKPVELSVWMPPLAPFLELPESHGHLGTNSRMQLRLRSAAINKITVTARRIFDNNMVSHKLNDSTRNMARFGRKVAQQTYEIATTPNQVQNSEIDLRELLGPGATGVYGIRVKGETPNKELVVTSYTGEYYDYDAQRDSRLEESTVFNLSNLGIIAKQGAGEVVTFIAALDTAQPLANIQVRVFSDKQQLMGEAVTDATGVAIIGDLDSNNPDAVPAVVVAQNAEKTEISMLGLDNSLMYREGFESDGRPYLRDGYEAFLTSERGAYRPGETAHLAGFIRGRDAQPPGSAFPLEVVVERPDGKKMTPQVNSGTATGLLNFDVTIPDYAPTGLYSVDVRMPGTGDESEDDGYDYY